MEKEIRFHGKHYKAVYGPGCSGCGLDGKTGKGCTFCDDANNSLCDLEPGWGYEEFNTQVNTEVDKTINPGQGRKYDAGKPMYNLIPADALEEVVMVLTKGAIKYNEPIDQENWRLVDNPQSRYFAAAQRHLWADKRGEFKDNGEGGTDCYHLACAISSLLFKLQLRIEEEKRNVE